MRAKIRQRIELLETLVYDGAPKQLILIGYPDTPRDEIVGAQCGYGIGEIDRLEGEAMEAFEKRLRLMFNFKQTGSPAFAFAKYKDGKVVC